MAPPTRKPTKELKDTLWKAAEKLRGSVPANQYKDVILGLVFLQYAAEAHWKSLADNAKSPNIGRLVDEAIGAVMAADPALAGTLPQLYHNVDQRRLGELVELLDNARFAGQGGQRARDLMGEVYEYFLGSFARTEGRRGGEFFTPPSVVRVIVEILEPAQRTGVRPVLRVRRDVRADRAIHRRTRRRPRRRVDLRPGKRRRNVADGQDEPRRARYRRHPPGRAGTRSSVTSTPAWRWTT